MQVKVGNIYEVKKTANCGSFDNSHYAKFIKITNIDTRGDLYYDILDEKLNKLDTCNGCFDENDLINIVKTLENLVTGDILLNEDDSECMVLAIVDKLVFLSEPDDFESSNSYFTTTELESNGFSIKEQEEDLIEITLEEVAKLKGVDVSKLRIKE